VPGSNMSVTRRNEFSSNSGMIRPSKLQQISRDGLVFTSQSQGFPFVSTRKSSP